MNSLCTKSFERLAKSKYPKSETEPYNPWAVCNKSTGGKKDSPDKFERCVHHLKDQNRKKNKKKKKAGIDDIKDVQNRQRLKTRSTPFEVFDKARKNELSGRAVEEEDEQMGDVWRDALMRSKSRRQQEEEQRQKALAFVVESKKKE